ncbi:CBU_0592 family membrane protein [Flagellimonas marina]|uniref:CBU-0592-like domain-containing protein n=1 Tax=Flagellimonas marina TaxID=1775168 RepID=A0ABV8PNJ3_9FLAO
MTDLIVDLLGWTGSIMLVTAYWLNSKNRISAQTLLYQLLNILGSLLLMTNTIYYGAYPSSSVNIVWLLIGLIHITAILKNRHKTI